MILAKFAKQAEKFAADNSPAILTGIGVIGSLTAAYLSGKASFKAAKLINEEETHRTMYNEPTMETKDKVLLVWKEYIPAVGTTALTVTCIVSANRIGTRRAAAMAAAYTISEKAFSEYKEKVIQKLGENKERAVRDELAQERVNRNPATGAEVIIAGGGDVLCYDSYSGRYFKSSMQEIKKAENDVNYKIIHDLYASLGDFYNLLGLPGTKFSEEVGWTSDHLVGIVYATVLADDGTPCLAIDYMVEPVRGYNQLG